MSENRSSFVNNRQMRKGRICAKGSLGRKGLDYRPCATEESGKTPVKIVDVEQPNRAMTSYGSVLKISASCLRRLSSFSRHHHRFLNMINPSQDFIADPGKLACVYLQGNQSIWLKLLPLIPLSIRIYPLKFDSADQSMRSRSKVYVQIYSQVHCDVIIVR